MPTRKPNSFFKYTLTIILLMGSIIADAQNKNKFTTPTKNAFYAADAVIENIGQYGETYKGQEQMGAILYGYEGHSMPILFTKKGLIFLQRKVEKISKAEEEKLEKQGLPEEQIEHKKTVIDKAITMEWIGANPNPVIEQTEKTSAYHTYGLLTEKAYGCKKLTYKNLYNGIDLVYYFTDNTTIGFEYSLVAQAGADLSQIKMRYGGDTKKLQIDKQGNLIVKSDIEGIEQTAPISYYSAVGSGQLAKGNEHLPGNNEQQTTNSEQQTPNILPTRNEKTRNGEIKTTYKFTNTDISYATVRVPTNRSLW
jgi:hypothetical protein